MQKKLYKSRTDKVLDGVCGGIASYFGVDAVIIRLLWVVVSIVLGLGFLGVVAYIIAMIIIPIEPYTRTNDAEDDFLFEPRPTNQGEDQHNSDSSYAGSNRHPTDHESKNKFSLILGYTLVSLGVYLLLEKVFHFRLHDWFNEIQPYVWPILLIILGIFLLTRRARG